MQTYADDYNELDRYGYQPRWDTWGRLTQSVFANIPLITTIGALVHSIAAASHAFALARAVSRLFRTACLVPERVSASGASFRVCHLAQLL